VRPRLSTHLLAPFLAVVLASGPSHAFQSDAGPPPPTALAPSAHDERISDAELSVLFEGAFLQAENGQDFRETPGLRKILEQLARFDPADLTARAKESFDITAALADPRAYQGRFFRRRGLLVGLEAVRLRTPIFEHEDIYRATLTDLRDGVVVDMLEAPPKLELGRDVVDVEGVFYRTVRYENRDGKPYEAPYFIAGSMVRVDPDAAHKSSRLDLLGLLIAGAALAYALIRGSMILLKHRRDHPPGPGGGIRARAEENRRQSMAESKGTLPSSPSSEERV